MIQKILKEPLFHFLLAGFFIFVYSKSCSKKGSLENTITVDKASVLNYMQYHSKAFNTAVFEEKLDQLPSLEKKQLVQQFIQDEILYREALKLGLDQNDFVIKRRLIQKMAFILDDFDEKAVNISEDSIQAYYRQHSERYFQSANYTFTHIYFKSSSNQDSRKKALVFMQKEAHQRLSQTESLAYGDRFLYHRNYAEKTTDFLKSQFESDFVQALHQLEVDQNQWQGPILSKHGYHWVKLIKKTNAGLTDLNNIRSIVETDYINDLKQIHKNSQIDQLIKNYKINNKL